MKKNVVIPALLFGAVAAGGLFYLTHAMTFKVAAAVPPAPVPVVAGVVAQHDVPIYQNGVGTVIAYNTDVVRAQIQGQLISINFTEGQTVHAGDLLAQIDPRPYQAQIDQFEGNLERDQAQLTNARANFTRYSQLGDKGWATPQLIETQKAQVGQLEAAIKTDQALIEAAKVQLSYTRLTSPIDGVVGIRQIDVGNIISPTTTNGLVVVTQLDPISLIFTLPEGVLPQILGSSKRPRRRFPSSLITRTIRSSWERAYSRWSTTRFCRPPDRSSSRLPFPTNPARCGRVNWSMRGCSSRPGTTA
jgi:multidrug efflux system membrane fusion protein